MTTLFQVDQQVRARVFGRFDLSFDATKVVFCHAKEGDTFRIFEIDIDPKTGRRTGTKLRQLTHSGDEEAKTIKQFGGTNCGTGYDDIDKLVFGRRRDAGPDLRNTTSTQHEADIICPTQW